MEKKISYGIEIKSPISDFDLLPFIDQWNPQLDIQVNNLQNISNFPIIIIPQVPSSPGSTKKLPLHSIFCKDNR